MTAADRVRVSVALAFSIGIHIAAAVVSGHRPIIPRPDFSDAPIASVALSFAPKPAPAPPTPAPTAAPTPKPTPIPRKRPSTKPAPAPQPTLPPSQTTPSTSTSPSATTTGETAADAVGAARMRSYLSAVLAAVQAEKYYPPAARRQGIEASIPLSFTVEADGSVRDLIVGAGPESLRRAARETVDRAAPFPPPPDAPAPVSFTMVYRLR